MSQQIELTEEWYKIYDALLVGETELFFNLFNAYVDEEELFDNNEYMDNIVQHLHPIFVTAIENENIEVLEWLNSLSYYEIDSFELYLVAAQQGNIEVIKWGLSNSFDLLPHHILHAVRNGQLNVLEFAIERVEGDPAIFFNELFVKNAIVYEQVEIVEFYKSKGIEIDPYKYKSEDLVDLDLKI